MRDDSRDDSVLLELHMSEPQLTIAAQVVIAVLQLVTAWLVWRRGKRGRWF